MSTRKPAPQRLSIYAKGFSRIIDCISLHILDEYLNRKKGNIYFALFEGMSLRKGPAGRVSDHDPAEAPRPLWYEYKEEVS